jgi:hypothetical protein
MSVVAIRLNKFSGDTLLDTATEKIEFVIEWDYDIIENQKDRLVLSASCSIGFRPEAVIKLELQYYIMCQCSEEVSEEEIRTEIDKILAPCGVQNTLTVGILSDKMMGAPLIVPPQVVLTSKNKAN